MRFHWTLLLLSLLALTWRGVGLYDATHVGFVGVADEDDVIVNIVAAGPAATAGLRVDDRVVSIENVDGLPVAGQQVTYVVERDGEMLRFEMTAEPLAGERLRQLVAYSLMGLVFLVCGWIGFVLVGSLPSKLVALQGLAEFVHWGAFPILEPGATRTAMISVLFLSTMFGAAFFCQFTLTFPDPWPSAWRRRTLGLLYGPIAVAAALGATAIALPAATFPITLFFLVENVHAYAATLVGLAILIVRLRRLDRGERRATGVSVVLWGVLAATVPYVVVSIVEALAPDLVLPGGLGSEQCVLLFTLIPLSLLYALLLRAPRLAASAAAL